ncbi:MAG TPA: aminodeoxychorismate synthase component I [Pyrinomonadaceae bacterium]|jgi:para-aminobenzoate synthetase/4-amino-4-deoxychorismate lyase
MNSSPDGTLLVFDFADEGGARKRIGFRDPARVIVAESAGEVRVALREVQSAAAAGYYAAGYVGYEAAPAFDAALAVRAGAKIPPLWFGVFDNPERRDEHEPPGQYAVSEWSPEVDRQTYERNFRLAREAIARGDTYQINYTFMLRARFAGDDFAFYRQLAASQRADYCAYLRLGRFCIVSASPELFFRWRGVEIAAKPMKGTARRGRWLEEDDALAEGLAASEKNRAENLMIVDLMRNDLGRVAEFGSVGVRDRCVVERYPTVLQMTSTVEARTRAGVSLEDVFAATFPCGSVTGAPKVSTTRLIAALEASPRNVYCGSVGFVAPGGEAVFNVAIRTALIDRETGEAEYGVGGGITWDSAAAEEYEEALSKSALLSEGSPRFMLLETLRLERGAYALLPRHLRRLDESARYFGFRVSPEAARAALDEHAASFPDEARRVRLLASEQGEIHVESAALAELPTGPLRVALATAPVRRADRFLYHKTTRREVYDSHRARHPAAFDVLLWNEGGEITEFTNGNLVVEIEGRRLTPARASGLLAGTMRAELLERGEIGESVVSRADLARSSRMWLVNSVRGWVSVSLREE